MPVLLDSVNIAPAWQACPIYIPPPFSSGAAGAHRLANPQGRMIRAKPVAHYGPISCHYKLLHPVGMHAHRSHYPPPPPSCISFGLASSGAQKGFLKHAYLRGGYQGWPDMPVLLLVIVCLTCLSICRSLAGHPCPCAGANTSQSCLSIATD